MGGEGGFWRSDLDLWNEPSSQAFLNGIVAIGDPLYYYPIGDNNENPEDAGAIVGWKTIFSDVVGAGSADTQRTMGLLRATAVAFSAGVNTTYFYQPSVADTDSGDYGQRYVYGPFLKAVLAIEEGWYDSHLIENTFLPVAGNNDISAGQGVWEIPDYEVYDPSYTDADSAPAKLADLLNAKTVTYISEVEDLDDFLGILSALVGAGPTFANIYTAVANGADFDIDVITAGTVTLPASTFTPTSLPSTPTISTIAQTEIVLDLDAAIVLNLPGDLPTVSAPTQVTLTDETAAAIAAFTVAVNERFDLREAELISGKVGTRYTSADTLETQIAGLVREREREIATYTAELDLNKMNKNADMEVEYERQKIEVAKLNGEFSIRYDQLEQSYDGVLIAFNQLKLAKEQANAELEQRYVETLFQSEKTLGDYAMQLAQLGQHMDDQELQDAAQRLQAAIAQVQADIQVGIANESSKTEHLRSNVDLARSIFDATGAWMRNKTLLLSNAGPMADMIKTGVVSESTESQFAREFFLKHWDARLSNAVRVSGAYAADAELRNKSVNQNLATIREAMAAQGIALAGTERNPSGFENLMTGLGAGLSGMGSLVNMASVAGVPSPF